MSRSALKMKGRVLQWLRFVDGRKGKGVGTGHDEVYYLLSCSSRFRLYLPGLADTSLPWLMSLWPCI